MRILFVSTPGQGHVRPLLGLALAAGRLGHRVAWATGAEALPLLKGFGVECFDVAPPFGTSLAAFRHANPDLDELPGRLQAGRAFPGLFGAVMGLPMVAPLGALVERWRPALLVNEPAALAAPLVAACHGVAQLTHDFGMPIPASLLQAAAEVMAPAWREVGLPMSADAGVYAQAVVEIVPPSMRAASANLFEAPQRLAQQPASMSAPPETPTPPSLVDFLSAVGDRPLIYATFGTVHRGGAGWQAMLQALQDLGLPCVITSGPFVPPPTMAERPDLACVAPYIPQDWVLPHCTAVISNAGAGVCLAAAARGLPQLCLPFGADQFRNADALAATGAAAVLEGASTQTIAAAALALLEEPRWRDAAQRLRSEFQARPTAHDSAAALSTITRRG